VNRTPDPMARGRQLADDGDGPHDGERTPVTTTTVCCPVCRTPIDGPGQALANATRVCPPCWQTLVRFVRRLPRTVCT
jgi:hypothetical protein